MYCYPTGQGHRLDHQHQFHQEWGQNSSEKHQVHQIVDQHYQENLLLEHQLIQKLLLGFKIVKPVAHIPLQNLHYVVYSF